MYKLAPSILSANFVELGKDIKIVEYAGADYLHIDVMDGHFVPNISLGIPVLQDINKFTRITLDVHLMIMEPERYIKKFVESGADIITVHQETCRDLNYTIDYIKSLGVKTSVAIKPNTPVETLFEYCEKLDMVLIMSVEPGFGGQTLIPETLTKAKTIFDFKKQNNLNFDIEMDGGISLNNLDLVLQSGVNVVVAGSSVFGTNDKTKAVMDFYEKFNSFK